MSDDTQRHEGKSDSKLEKGIRTINARLYSDEARRAFSNFSFPLLRYYCFFHFVRQYIRAYGPSYEQHNGTEARPGRNKGREKRTLVTLSSYSYLVSLRRRRPHLSRPFPLFYTEKILS